MTLREGFRCYIVGTESLLIQCADILLRAGHTVAGVVSSDQGITSWAAERGIRTLPFDAQLAAALEADGPFDYLFSIANLKVLPDAVLRLPARGTINFHDGPLPRYAGLYTTTWALLRGERQYGVTWHEIATGIDTGDILEQELFDLDPTETALTLNAKCYEAGIRTFTTLVADLTNGTLRPRAQDMSQRAYFGAFTRPEAACTIFWDRPAEEIDALVRALDFGGYMNPLGLPHTIVNGQVFLVAGLDLLDDGSTMPAGTVVTVDGSRIRVATATADVRVTRVLTADGAKIEIAELVSRLRIAEGVRLESPSEALASPLTELHQQIARHESFWVKRLETVTPLDLAYIKLEALGMPGTQMTRVDTQLPESLRSLSAASEDTDAYAAAVLAYLARLTDAETFDVAFSEDARRALVGETRGWFSEMVPLRVALDPTQTVATQLDALRAELTETRRRQTFTRDVYGRYPQLRAAAGASSERTRWPVRIDIGDRFDGDVVTDHTAALTIRIAPNGACAWFADPQAIDTAAVRRMQRQLAAFVESALREPTRAARELSLLPGDERQQVLVDWNQTVREFAADSTVHELIAAQAARTPTKIAIAHRQREMTYQELDARAERLAIKLRALNVGPDVIVGLAAERSIEMMIGLLGILKAGGAYLPLDPEYPADRLAFMVEDSRAPVVVTQRALAHMAPANTTAVFLDDLALDSSSSSAPPSPATAANSSNLAYVIYTSGSTGKPKGVMVTHRNVSNFFTAMDEQLDGDRDGVWLAVTSLSFDISVLELLWTLARGFKVVLHSGRSSWGAGVTPHPALSPFGGEGIRLPRPASGERDATPTRLTRALGAPAGVRGGIDFSLFYFSSDEGQDPADRYRLLLEGAKFADREGFTAVWTPERHFHAFGGLYPNPSVVSAAIAALTTRVQIRAGSVVLPLHHPARVAEEWALVDNLSQGRVGISVASGWQPNDFVLQPANYAEAKAIMMRNLDVIRRLWRGEQIAFPGPKGDLVPIRTLPRPIQRELPVWITSAGNPETFRMAGEAGAFVLTHLLGQGVRELKDKLDAYRQAWKASGHPGNGHVTLMLHTFVGTNDDEVREIVRGPMKQYLGSSVSLLKGYASTFPAFKQTGGKTAADIDSSFSALTPEDLDALLEHSFSRYYETGGLFGTPDSCTAMIADVQAVGVDEIACLIDFGVPTDQVLDSLVHLNTLRQRHSGPASVPAEAAADDGDDTPAGEIRRHHVTHLQCTPSLASMLTGDHASRAALGSLRRMLVGGEALSADLAADLRRCTTGTVLNMYGPTETTVWSSTYAPDGAGPLVPIGRPIANTQLYILDRHRQPVPIGLPGELYIGGDGVTRGYLHRPELTAERFVDDPFVPGASARLYRTGDLVRYRADGVIEFLGRIDHQVKIRGHRIELGEIEAAIRADNAVRDTVVVVREDTPGDHRLVGYVVPQAPSPDGQPAAQQAGQPLDLDALKSRLKAALPDVMVPSTLVKLDTLPRTPNGKIDRRALPKPESVSAAPRVLTAGARPESGVEATIAGIWQDVLHIPVVGLDDNFFDLGGHSLLTVQVLARVREHTGQNIPITDMFRFPTVRLLAGHLSGATKGSAALERGQARADARRNARRRQLPPS